MTQIIIETYGFLGCAFIYILFLEKLHMSICGYVLAKNRNRSAGVWFLNSFLLNIWAIIILYCSKKLEYHVLERTDETETYTKEPDTLGENLLGLAVVSLVIEIIFLVLTFIKVKSLFDTAF